ncbi:MAG: 6-carboxytetrahydropterin synthase [Nitrospinae bacterium]|nr:6-carboxytetrahydropterin synthase [Nitrospinota bacterium]
MYELSIETGFSSAHQLVGYSGNCENIHGHNWKVRVFLRVKELNDIGIGMDFREIKKVTDDLLLRLDHVNINKVSPFDCINPSSENIARWLFQQIGGLLNSDKIRVSRVEVMETDHYSVSYFEEGLKLTHNL